MYTIELGTKRISTKAIASKLDIVFKSLKDEPYITVSIQKNKKAKPDAVILSNDIFDLLRGKAEVCDQLLQSPEFAELRTENRKLARQVNALLGELQKRMGENEKLDDGVWREIKESLAETMQKQAGLWVDVETDEYRTDDYGDL